jgi:hypothetical protein
MRNLVILAVIFAMVSPVVAQTDQFPLTDRVISSDTEDTPVGTMQSRDSRRSRVIYQTVVTAEIGDRIYRLSGSKILDPGNYAASIDKNTVRLLLKDKDGKLRTIKLRVVSVAKKE